MSPRTLNRRHFERSLGSGRDRSRQGENAARKFYYERLSRVTVRHTYYDRSQGRRPSFTARPTPTTRELMHDLGLLFRQDEHGFSILYNLKTQQDLFAFLRRQWPEALNQPQPPPPCWQQRVENWTPGIWARLSFVLALSDPYFLNFTQIPIDTNPGVANFFFSNQNAHETSTGAVLLTPPGRNRVTGADLLEVVPSQLRVEFCPDAEQLWVSSISGEVVACLPRCFELEALTRVPVDDIDCRYAVACSPDPPEGVLQREQVYVNFAKLPEDKYLLEQVDAQCQPVTCLTSEDEPGSRMPQEVLYTELYPMPLCFIDLLFTNPNGQQPGIYPVRNLWKTQETRVEEVDYVLRFTRRETWWSYYIVPQPRWEPFENLRIESRGHRVEFAGPCCVRLADGSRAYRFVSKEPLALEQHSRYRFQLFGRRLSRNGLEETLVERLPVASNRQVLPEKPALACEALENSLCEEQPQPTECEGLQLEICGAEHRRNYSDIYVYI